MNTQDRYALASAVLRQARELGASLAGLASVDA